MHPEPEQAARVLDAVALEIDSHYPRDVWPQPTDEQLVELHGFARSIGLPDGSRFHVGGIRHATALIRAEAARIRTEMSTS